MPLSNIQISVAKLPCSISRLLSLFKCLVAQRYKTYNVRKLKKQNEVMLPVRYSTFELILGNLIN